ncbi:non-hydrolyzing UDP-N-acetylglucosamine 2-epimerase [Sedimenticola hydrogenitrophicus]|uniref:non-hydrolyzing UDP-N-acetylglucosamine 2-epimerase n=1 Tax=Sedimenticola hydrogenitrophicus TaxID=2967975 RepID=UPI0021A7F964|nr:UDP-N-acetylglucosamine 2-epimerase (non-hydrolyzing) [Sedimenticola hydrogenitrophicus]
MKIVTIIGARPQFIKAATVSRVIRDRYADKIDEVLVHTGQHYDDNMSKVFFDELNIPRPCYNLEISGGNHGVMTGRMLESVESVLLQEKPDWVLIYGDTNSTLAGALAAAKLHIPVAHVEAGLRSFNMRMPEEINRILADRVSTKLFCPTEAAVVNLQAEGLTRGVHNSGDVMYDAALFYREKAKSQSTSLEEYGLTKSEFALATCHRAENTDDPERLGRIVNAFGSIAKTIPVVLPLHPRTRKQLVDYGLTDMLGSVKVTEPLPFLDMVALEQAATVILTDSGGVQKEAFFYGVPCITLRDETEWVETISTGANLLVGSSTSAILAAFDDVAGKARQVIRETPYGAGDAAGKIVSLLAENKS